MRFFVLIKILIFEAHLREDWSVSGIFAECPVLLRCFYRLVLISDDFFITIWISVWIFMFGGCRCLYQPAICVVLVLYCCGHIWRRSNVFLTVVFTVLRVHSFFAPSFVFHFMTMDVGSPFLLNLYLYEYESVLLPSLWEQDVTYPLLLKFHFLVVPLFAGLYWGNCEHNT